MTPRAAVTGAGHEASAWLRGTMRLMRRWPGQVLVLAACLWCVPPSPPFVTAAAAAAAALRLWARLRPVSFHRWALAPLRIVYWRLRVRRRWEHTVVACGLADWPHGFTQAPHRSRPLLPVLRRISSERARLTAHVRPLVGQTVEDYAAATERLRMALGAVRVRVDPDGVNGVAVTFTIVDQLADPFPAVVPRVGSLDHVAMGRCEDGSEWRLAVGPHTLVAGSSGSGKGSVFWSFAFGLAASARRGVVQLHGVDLKGGMEVLMGEKLFTTRATNASEAVAVLERTVQLMQARTRQYAGSVRSHVASLNEPLHVVMIDELAALTAYCPERDLQRRAEMAINLLCSQGRAPGVMVLACLQDPRKEVIPARGLFTQMVGLRLKDAAESAMVLGDGAVSAGAICHRITRGQPGVGYVVPESGGHPLRVRAGYVSDAQIRAVAEEFAAPNQVPVPPALTVAPEQRMSRRAKSGFDPEAA